MNQNETWSIQIGEELLIFFWKKNSTQKYLIENKRQLVKVLENLSLLMIIWAKDTCCDTNICVM